MFLDHLEFDEYMNCSGLTGIRRLVTKRCSDLSCQHRPSYPAALYWALPIIKTQFARRMPSIDRTLAHLWEISIMEKDPEVLGELVALVGKAHFQRILTWFCPVHFVICNIYTQTLARRESLRVLIDNGLDLHYLADERSEADPNHRNIRDTTPTSLAMRFSLNFFHFRDVLLQSGTQLSTFIEEELQQGPLVNMGWTPSTLQRLFELEFKPVELLRFTCTACRFPNRSSTEKAWQMLLKWLMEGGDPTDVSKQFEEAEEVFTDGIDGICWYCASHGIRPTQEDSSTDSPFLLSI
ncbi:hypothetical protein GLAREA_03525 [Glarea lozoyensis ATCC 20868]|uniref:Uncharacterized protein n=1 Tax=Glarea lozoyensis (strain ATCC 20868 / MF5171) TaxID=1116229 RepID=S3DVZ0_GLAL2|nr:uncharacterized protein GLAREA_03525 [Glarea lozoyensis ATCC 20868]EPE30558.1 hypothetical protein GLAREA_03525 [Glarea lozoyensis ATCC 20868]